MAEIDINKLKKGVLSDVLKQVSKGKESAFERVASEAAEKAREGKGLIGGAIASQKARMDVSNEYAIATKGTQGKRQAVLEGLLGRNLGDLFKNLGLEKMESPEKIKEARAKFGLDKKEKGERGAGGAGKLSKPISLILRNVIQTQKMVRSIEKALTKPSLKSGYTFDPRMAGGGRYKNTTTNKIVSAKEATGSSTPSMLSDSAPSSSASSAASSIPSSRTSALTAAIGADEEPLVKLRESIDEKFELIDKIKKDTSTIVLSLNGVTPTLGLLSVHDKLNLLIAKSALSGMGGIDLPGKTKPPGKKPPGRFGKVGGALSKVARVAGKIAAPLAVGMAAYDAYSGYSDAENVLGMKEGEKATTGQKLAAGAGSAISGLTFGLVDEKATARLLSGYDPDEQRLISNWAYSVHIGKAKLSQVPKQLLDGVKALLKNPPKNWGKGVGAPATKAAAPPPVVDKAPPTQPVAAVTPSALPGAGTVAAATTTAAAIPAAVGGAAAPTPPTPPAAQPKTFVQTAVEKAKEIGAGVVSGAKQVASAVSNLFSGPSPKLDQVTTKQNAGVDTSGLQGGMQERLARMAKAFQEVTGKKLMLTSAFRSDDKQMKLWTAKYNEIKAANPNADEAQLTKMTRKWVALPMALGGKGSAHNRGTAVDINSKGAAGIEAINGMTFNGQKVTTDSFLATFGLKRPLGHEPWHLQPLEGAPTPDNPDPNAKPLVADAKGNMVNLETGKAESVPPPPPMVAQETKSTLPAVSESGGPPPAAVGAQKQEQQTMTAAASAASPAPAAAESMAPAAADPLATMADGTAVDSKPMVAQSSDTGASLTPVQNTTGTQVAQGSSQLETSKMVAQASPPAPVVVNNNSGGGNQQPIQPPKTPMPKASSRSSESTFNRALAKDFSHPTSFTSAIVG